MIGQDLRYKKRFVPPLRPIERRYPFPRVRERTVIIDDGGRRFLQLAPSRITNEKDSGVHSSGLDE